MNHITISDMARYDYKINIINGMCRAFGRGSHFEYYKLIDYLDL